MLFQPLSSMNEESNPDLNFRAPAQVWNDVDKILCVVNTPTGVIVTGGARNGDIVLWNCETGEAEAELAGHMDSVVSLLYVPSITTLFSGSADSTIRSWNFATLEAVCVFDGHSGFVLGLAYQPAEECIGLYSGGDDNTIKLWNIDTGTCVHTFPGHTGPVNSLIATATHLYSASSDYSIRVWDLFTRQCVNTLSNAHDDVIWSLVLLTDGRLVSGSSDQKIRFWKNPVVYHEMTDELVGHSSHVRALYIQGHILFSAGQDHRVFVWNIPKMCVVEVLRPHVKAVTSLLVHNNFLFSTGFDCSVVKTPIADLLLAKQPYVPYVSPQTTMEEAREFQKKNVVQVTERTRAIRIRRENIATILSYYQTLPATVVAESIAFKCKSATLMNELIIYIAFMLLFVFFIVIAKSSDELHYAVRAISAVVEAEPIPGLMVDLKFEDIDGLDKLRNWLVTVFAPVIFAERIAVGSSSILAIAGQNIVVGAIRLRIVNANNHSCVLHPKVYKNFPLISTPCYGDEVEDTPKHIPQWNRTIEFVEDGGTITGQLDTYVRRGYVIDIPYTTSPKEATTLLGTAIDTLVRSNSLRFLSLSVMTYNPNVDAFLLIEYYVEGSSTGAWFTSSVNRSFITFQFDESQLVLESFFAAFLLFYILKFLVEFSISVKNRNILAFLFDVWNFAEASNLTIFIVMYYYRIVWIVESQNISAVVPQDDNKYPQDLQRIGDLYFQQGTWNAVNTILTFLKLLKFVRLNDSLNILTRTLSAAMNSLVGLLGLFLFLVFGFAISGNTIFGANLFEYRNIDGAFSSLLRILVGDFSFSTMLAENNVMAYLYFWLYVFIAFIILLNLIVAVINDGFADVCLNRVTIPMDESLSKALKDVRYMFLPASFRRHFLLFLHRKTHASILMLIRTDLMRIHHVGVPNDLETTHTVNTRVSRSEFLTHGRKAIEGLESLTIDIELFLLKVWDDIAWEYHYSLLSDLTEDVIEKEKFVEKVVDSCLQPLRRTMDKVNAIASKVEAQSLRLSQI
eukprot:PhF_6_TR37503/c0_g1_i1/m.55385